MVAMTKSAKKAVKQVKLMLTPLAHQTLLDAKATTGKTMSQIVEDYVEGDLAKEVYEK